MIPKNPNEMQSILTMAMITRVYGEVTEAARRGRLTEHDIATIERRVLADLRSADFSHEFETFETEPVVAAVHAMMENFFTTNRNYRSKKIGK